MRAPLTFGGGHQTPGSVLAREQVARARVPPLALSTAHPKIKTTTPRPRPPSSWSQHEPPPLRPSASRPARGHGPSVCMGRRPRPPVDPARLPLHGPEEPRPSSAPVRTHRPARHHGPPARAPRRRRSRPAPARHAPVVPRHPRAVRAPCPDPAGLAPPPLVPHLHQHRPSRRPDRPDDPCRLARRVVLHGHPRYRCRSPCVAPRHPCPARRRRRPAGHSHRHRHERHRGRALRLPSSRPPPEAHAAPRPT